MRTHTLRKVGLALTASAMFIATLAPTALANHETPFNGTVHDYGDMVDYDLTFPVAGPNRYSDGFWASRANGIHHATDIMADKMVPVVAAHDGVVTRINGSGNQSWIDAYGRCCTIHITHTDGWESVYIHLNNDTPGTDDGQGWGIAPGIALGVEVRAGQVIGYVGDSGNAEGTAPHLHFELYDSEGVAVNNYNALRAAEGATPAPVCEAPTAGALGALTGGTTLLRLGSRGKAVKQLQRFLTALGYRAGPVDGVLGSLTVGAVRAFQEGRGINPDGVVGATTRRQIKQVAKAMPAMPVLDPQGRIIRPGYRGEDVKDLQQLLDLAGFDPGPLDGVYGERTQGAVEAFQAAYGGLRVDGKLGPGTREALAAYLGLDDYRACS
jgi:peptidoglycan hydrolase-like protein with peptidoglycan-binding domain